MNLPKDIEDIPEIDIEFESKIIECKTKKLSDFGIYQVVKNQNIIMFGGKYAKIRYLLQKLWGSIRPPKPPEIHTYYSAEAYEDLKEDSQKEGKSNK